jgi:OOP family OmpA-OmpF porin
MLRAVLTATCAVVLLSACEQRQAVVAAASSDTPQPARTFTLFFNYNQASLSSEAQAVVGEAATAARSRRVARVTVAGHADTFGDTAYNQALSQRRAEMVKDALTRDGVNQALVAVVAHGESELMVSTKDRMREPKNRRVEIVVQ